MQLKTPAAKQKRRGGAVKTLEDDMLEVSVRENILQRLRGQPAEGSEVHSFGASKLKIEIEHGGGEAHFGSGVW